ncbi:MAG TPA: hypothetical protein VFM18_21330 [Methanosarcina sp.]|nr:hypothetical protein [Methanosarcina sp.]
MIHITISGPGRTFDAEVEVVKRALREFGYEVVVHDQYPFEGNSVCPTIDDCMERAKEFVKGKKIHIQTQHCPWGG